MRMNLMPMLDDLIKQSETEKSHFYVASVLKSCKEELLRLDGEITYLKHRLTEMNMNRDKIGYYEGMIKELYNHIDKAFKIDQSGLPMEDTDTDKINFTKVLEKCDKYFGGELKSIQ